MKFINKRNIKWLVAVILLATAIFLFIWRILPYSSEDISRSVVRTEHRYCYVISSEGTPLIYFDGISSDSLLINPSAEKKEFVENSLGCWINEHTTIPSCHGRIATVFNKTDSSVFNPEFIREVLNEEIINRDNELSFFATADEEIEYYIDTHDKENRGFADVLRYRDSLDCEKSRTLEIALLLKKAYESKNLAINKEESFYTVYKDINNKEIRQQCLRIPTYNENANCLLQTCDSITPDIAVAMNLWNLVPFKPSQLKDTVMVMGVTYTDKNDIKNNDIEIIPEIISGDTIKSFPRINIVKGSPVFTRDGIFIGIVGGDTIISRSVIRKTL